MAESEVNVSTIAQGDVPINPSYSISLPVSEEMAKALAVGDRVHVSFDAVLRSIDSGWDDTDQHDIRVDATKVKVVSENEWEEMAREDE